MKQATKKRADNPQRKVHPVHVFVLWHTHKLDKYCEDSKLIGIYASLKDAREAKKRAVKLPGFKDQPRGFLINRHELGKDHWAEGFITVD